LAASASSFSCFSTDSVPIRAVSESRPGLAGPHRMKRNALRGMA
jgi:hypothetical protein